MGGYIVGELLGERVLLDWVSARDKHYLQWVGSGTLIMICILISIYKYESRHHVLIDSVIHLDHFHPISITNPLVNALIHCRLPRRNRHCERVHKSLSSILHAISNHNILLINN